MRRSQRNEPPPDTPPTPHRTSPWRLVRSARENAQNRLFLDGVGPVLDELERTHDPDTRAFLNVVVPGIDPHIRAARND